MMEAAIHNQPLSADDLFLRIEANLAKINNQDIENLNRAAQAICRTAASRLRVGVDLVSLAADAVQDGLIAISSGQSDLKKLITSSIYSAIKGESSLFRPEDYNQEIKFEDFVSSINPDSSYDLSKEIINSTSEDMSIGSNSSQVEEEQIKRDDLNLKYAFELKKLIGSVALFFDEFATSPFLYDFLKRRFIDGQRLSEIARSVHNIRKAKQGIGFQRAKIIESGLIARLGSRINLGSRELLAIFSHCRSAIRILRRLDWELESSSSEEIFHAMTRPNSDRDAIEFLSALPASLLSTFHSNMPKIGIKRAEGLRAVCLPEMLETLKSEYLIPDSSFSLLRPYQKEKLEQLINTLINQKELTDHKLIADIAPPAAGKTFMMACLAKLAQLQGINSVFIAHSNSVLYGDDGALSTFKKCIGDTDVGIVNVDNQEVGKDVTLTTYKSISSKSILERICSESRPFLFLFDEGDLSQTEIRQQAIQSLTESLSFPILVTFSATKEVAGKNLCDRAYLSHEMKLEHLIKSGYAKHILGFYVQVPINAEANLIRNSSKELNFELLKKEEQVRLVDIPVEIYLKFHLGQQALIHCASIKQSERTAARLKALGIKAVSLTTGNTKQNKNGALQNDYISKKIQVLISCQMLDRGFSENGVTDVQIYATISTAKTKVYQSITRGIRPRADRRVLILYQMIPDGTNWRSVKPVLIEDVLDNYWELSGNTNKSADTPEKILKKLEASLDSSENSLRFTNCIGQHNLKLKAPKSCGDEFNSDILIIRRPEISWAVDTRSIRELRAPIAKPLENKSRKLQYKFSWIDLKKIGLLFQKESKIHLEEFTTKTPNQTLSVQWQNNKLSWRSFYSSVVAMLFDDYQRREHRKYYSDAVNVIKEACTERGITFQAAKQKFLKLKSEKDTKHLLLSLRARMIKENLLEIVEAFIKDYKLIPAEVTYGSVDPEAIVVTHLGDEQVLISWQFLISSGIRHLFPELSQQESVRCLGISTKLIFDWYSTGVRPDLKEAKEKIRDHLSSLINRHELEKLLPMYVPQIVESFFSYFGISSELQVNFSFPEPSSTIEWNLKSKKYSVRWEWLNQKVFRLIVPEMSQTEAARAPQACLDMTLLWWKNKIAPKKNIALKAWRERIQKRNQDDYVDRLLSIAPHLVIEPFFIQHNLSIDQISTTMPTRNTVAQIQIGPGIKFSLTWEGLIKKLFQRVIESLNIEFEGQSSMAMRVELAKLCFREKRIARLDELHSIIQAH